MRNGLVAVAFVVVTSISQFAFATVRSFEANLDALQVSPPNASPAFGLVDVTIDDATGQVTVTSGSYQDLLGGSSGVSLNGFASPGFNAAVLLALTLDQPGATSGTISGGGTLANQAAINGFLAGNTYIVVRSQVFPSGEIRGQLTEVPEPASIGAIALASMALLRWRSR